MAEIYKITNNITNEVYIGETTRTTDVRWKQHLYRAKNKRYTEYLYSAMRKYGTENFSVETIERCENKDRFHRETDNIIKYRSYVGFEDCNGYNLVLSQDKSTPLMDEQIIRYWNDGLQIIQISERLHINIKTISHALYNYGITKEEIMARRNKYIGEKSSKKVIQYTMDGEYINSYKSLTEAAKTLNKGVSQIGKACVGNYALTAYGYIWQYEENDNIEEIIEILSTKKKTGKNKKRIVQLDKNNNIINIYESASAAGRAFGKAHSAFAHAARTGGTAYGYYWKYEEE